jgi:predicted AAA+ superfamily ATPase
MRWFHDLFTSQWQKDVTATLLAIKSMQLTIRQEIRKMSELTERFNAELQELVEKVAANGNAVQSAIVAIQELAAKQAELIQELKDAQAINDPIAIQAALESLEAQNDALAANTEALAAAIPANTEP